MGQKATGILNYPHPIPREEPLVKISCPHPAPSMRPECPLIPTPLAVADRIESCLAKLILRGWQSGSSVKRACLASMRLWIQIPVLPICIHIYIKFKYMSCWKNSSWGFGSEWLYPGALAPLVSLGLFEGWDCFVEVTSRKCSFSCKMSLMF